MMPKRVAVVAWGFVIVGALVLVSMLVQLVSGDLSFNLTVLLLPAGVALFQGGRASRRWAAFFLGTAIASFAGMALFALRPPSAGLTIGIFGRSISGGLPVGITLAVLAVACAVGIWALYSGPASAFFAGGTSSEAT